MNKQIYAVGLKDYIELRTASKPPQLKITKRVKQAQFTNWEWEIAYGRMEKVPVVYERKLPITCHHFVGGRFLGSLKRRRSLCGKLSCGRGKVIEVSPEL